MVYSLALTALLCVTTWITSLHTANGQASYCCIVNRGTRVRLENIVSYRLQVKGFCPIDSVVFMTNKYKVVCWDPQEPFAQKAMRRLDQVEQAKEAATTPATTNDSVLTTAQLSSSNSTQIQTEVREERAVDNGRKKNSKNGMKRKSRNRRRMRNRTVNKQ